MSSGEEVAECDEIRTGRKMAKYYRKKRRKDEKDRKQDGKVQKTIFDK